MSGGDEVSVAPDAPAVMDVQAALRAVLRAAYFADGLAKGLHEAAKALDKREAHFCVLAENCDEPMYVKLVEALCNEHSIPLIKISDKKIIGEWIGLCKYDREGKPRNVVGCSCVAVKTFATEEQGRCILSAFFDAKK